MLLTYPLRECQWLMLGDGCEDIHCIKSHIQLCICSLIRFFVNLFAIDIKWLKQVDILNGNEREYYIPSEVLATYIR